MWRLAANPFNITSTDIGLPNSTKTVSDGFSSILSVVMGVVGGLALVFVIVGALQMVLSNGDPKRFAQGRETITYAVVGIIVAIAGYALVAFFAGASQGKH